MASTPSLGLHANYHQSQVTTFAVLSLSFLSLLTVTEVKKAIKRIEVMLEDDESDTDIRTRQQQGVEPDTVPQNIRLTTADGPGATTKPSTTTVC